MSQTKLERIASIEEQIAQLKNQQKQLKQQHNEQERKARTKRLCSRGGYLESRLPEVITLTDEQYKTLLEKTLLSEYARKILNGFTKQNGEITANQPTETVTQENNSVITKLPAIEVEYDENGEEYGDDEETTAEE